VEQLRFDGGQRPWSIGAASWPGPTVLGYRGLLERVRFALDPGTGGPPMFFFGPTA